MQDRNKTMKSFIKIAGFIFTVSTLISIGMDIAAGDSWIVFWKASTLIWFFIYQATEKNLQSVAKELVGYQKKEFEDFQIGIEKVSDWEREERARVIINLQEVLKNGLAGHINDVKIYKPKKTLMEGNGKRPR